MVWTLKDWTFSDKICIEMEAVIPLPFPFLTQRLESPKISPKMLQVKTVPKRHKERHIILPPFAK